MLCTFHCYNAGHIPRAEWIPGLPAIFHAVMHFEEWHVLCSTVHDQTLASSWKIGKYMYINAQKQQPWQMKANEFELTGFGALSECQ